MGNKLRIIFEEWKIEFWYATNQVWGGWGGKSFSKAGVGFVFRSPNIFNVNAAADDDATAAVAIFTLKLFFLHWVGMQYINNGVLIILSTVF